MDWNAVVIAINTIINDVRKEQVLQNDAIRDDIFSILEKIVLYCIILCKMIKIEDFM